MKKKVLVLIVVLALLAVATMPAFAGVEEPVTCTVTPVLLSVSVSPLLVEYGVVPLGGNTTSASITATNNGSGTEDLGIKGANATGTAVTPWTLSPTAVGTDQYMHKFSTDLGSTWTALTVSAQTLANDIAKTGTQDFMLKIYTPSSISGNYVEMTTTVTVVALTP